MTDIFKNLWNNLKYISNLKYVLNNEFERVRYEQEFNLKCVYLQDKLLHDNSSGVTSHQYCDKEIIISLTSYGRRIEAVWLTIESLMQQSAKANKIILWLDDKIDFNNLPSALLKQQQRGLTIKKYADIKSYKKLLPALLHYPEDVIITVDDDVIYDFGLIDRMILSYLKSPDKIHACRTHVISLDKKGNLKKYSEWHKNSSDTENKNLLFFVGVGGVLYPPHALDPEVFNVKVFSTLCPYADDVWFNAMALKKNAGICKVKTLSPLGEDYLLNLSVQSSSLSSFNTGKANGNDIQINSVYEKYNLFPLLHSQISKQR